MPKQQDDNLELLVRTMSKSEKRHFTLYAKRNAAKGEALFVQLFDYLSKRGTYDEEAVLKAIPGIRRSQLHNLRSKLYRELLVSLRLLHSSNRLEMAIREQIDFAQILYDKGLYRQSLGQLDRAKKKALEVDRHALALEITMIEKRIESQHITRSMDTRADELSSLAEELLTNVHRQTKFSNLSLQLYNLYLKMGHARNKQEEAKVKEYFTENLPEYEEKDLGFYEKLYLYQSFVWLYQITQEFPKQYRYAQKWVELFEEDQELIRNNISLYLKGLHNLLNVLYLAFQYDKFKDNLSQLLDFNKDNAFILTKNEQSLLTMFSYVHELNLHFLDGTFSEGKQLSVEIESILIKNPYNWDIHRNLVFYYKLACIHFGAGDNEKSIDLLNKIINQSTPDVREDIQSFARILNLIAHFELGNDVLVSYQIKSVYRYLLKMKEMNATHSAILKFVRRTPGMTPEKLRDEFSALKQTLLNIQGKRFEKRSGLYLDIISWLESKIEGRPVQDVIRRKFEERLAAAE